jgi:hypothetical protein
MMMLNNGINIDDWDTPIYRVFKMEWFEELIKTQKNGLVNPTEWKDPYDKFLFNCEIVDDQGDHISLSSISKDWFGQCWKKRRDSDAMWRIYSDNEKMMVSALQLL